MNRNSIDRTTTAPTDVIYVSWSESWDIVDYVERYLRSRSYASSSLARDTVMKCIARYPGRPPYRKADMDYYLDRNIPAFGPLPPRVK